MFMPAHAADGIWNVDADGTWSTAANWSASAIADGASSKAYFTNDTTAIRAVTLDSARTNGGLFFADADAVATPGGWVLTGSTLTLSNSSAAPAITVNPINNGDATNDARIASVLAGGQGFVKNGAGTLTLVAANTFTGTPQLDEGIVLIGNASALGAGNRAVNFNGGGVRVTGGGPAFGNTNNILTTGSIISSNGNYDSYNSYLTGSGTLLVHAITRLTMGGANVAAFASFTGTIDLTDSTTANELRVNLGSGSVPYNLSTVTLNCGTNGGRFDFRTTVSPVTIRIGALLGEGNSSLQSSEQATGPQLTWEIGYLNTSTTFGGRLRNRNDLPDRVGHLTKVGTGRLTLTNNNHTYAGNTTVSTGVLALTGAAAIINSPKFTISSTGIFDVSGLTTPFALSAAQTLTGSGVVTGDVSLVTGTISPGSGIGTLSLSNNLTLDGITATTNLFEITGPGTSDLLLVAGNLTLNNTVVIRCTPTGGSIPNGTYPLIRWGGSLTGDTNNLVLEYPAQLGTLVLGTNLVTKEIVLQVSGVPGATALTWRGDGAANDWDAATLNWRDAGNTARFFSNGDNVTFNDTGSNNVPVNLATAVNPGSTVVNATKNYVFGSSGGKISGTGSLLKTNTGKLTVVSDNDYTGFTTIASGILEIGDGVTTAGSLGTGNLTNNARLVFNRPDDIAFSTVINGTGQVVKASANTVTLNGASIYTGGTTISNGTLLITSASALGSGTVNLSGGILSGATLAVANPINLVASSTINNTSGELQFTSDSIGGSAGTLTLTGGTMRFTGSGFTFNQPIDLQLTGALQSYNQFGNQTFNGVISGPGVYRRRWPSSDLANTGTTILNGANTYAGGTLLREGSIGFGISSVSSSPPTVDSGPIGTSLLTQDTGTIYTSVFASGGSRTVGNAIALNTGGPAFTIKGGFDLTLSGAIDLGGGAKTIEVVNTARTIFSGDISNGDLVKTGTGSLYVNGNNNATTTTVSTGTLGGTGTFFGPVTVASGASLAPGNSVGTLTINSDLTINGNLAIEVDKSLSPSNDVMTVTGVLTNGGTGTLTVSNLGPALVVGDKFTLFSQQLLNGGALTIVGGGAGVTWNNNLAANGSISVASIGTSQPPLITSTVISGSNITISGTNGTAGGSFTVLSSTSLTTPRASWTVETTGTFGAGGSFSVNIPVSSTTPAKFYLLKLP